jgi:hypothetical protein
MKLFRYLFYLFFVLIFISSFSTLFAAEQDKEIDTFIEKQQVIFKKLDLDEDQTKQIKQLLKDYNLQSEEDRQRFANNVSTLIKRATKRWQTLTSDIAATLSPDQKRGFESIFKLDPLEWELFTIREALILSPIQTNTVEYILMKVQEEYRRWMPQQTGVRGTGRPPTSRVLSKGQSARMRRFMGSMLKSREARKVREIKKIVTKEQQKRFKQYRKIRKKQINEMLEEMKRQSSPPPLL